MLQNTLAKLIKKEYLQSIIYPLLIIEMMLLGAYFWSNSYVNVTTQNALIEETKIQINEISKRSATIINNEFNMIANLTLLFQKEHETFFSTYSPTSLKDSAYTQTSNGVIYNSKKKENSCGLFFSNVKKERPHRLSKAIATEKLDTFYNTILSTNPNIAQLYFNSHDSMNRLCPFMPDALNQYAHDIDIPTYNFYYLADKEHNPQKKVVWTDAYLDPAGLGWMISAIAPVYKENFLEGVVGIDVTIDQLIKNILTLKLPYTSMSLLVDENGQILGMNQALEPLLGLKELTNHDYKAPVENTISKPQDFNLFSHKTNPLALYLSQMIKENRPMSEFYEKENHQDFIITQNDIPATGWKIILLLDKESLLNKSTVLKQKTDIIGFIALGLMALFYLIFLFLLLKRANRFANQILLPLQDLIEATKNLKDKLTTTKIKHSNIVEINTLLDNFMAMSKELQELYDSMDKKIKEGVIEHMETQKMMIYQSRLAQMGEMISMIAHQWRQPLGAISTVTASIKLKHDLKKFDLSTEEGRHEQALFLKTAVDKIENYIHFLTTTIDDFRNFFKPERQYDKTSLETILSSSIKLIGKSLDVHQITLHVKNDSLLEFISYETKITQVIINILKNAQDVILEKQLKDGTIWINAYEDSAFFIVEIEDNAGGIPEAILDKIFDPYFSTKTDKNGTGLGLYMSKMIIEEHCHGVLEVINTSKGAKFIIKIRGEQSAG